MSHIAITITKYSHHFSVTKIQQRARLALGNFVRRYVQKGYTKTAEGFRNMPTKVYGAATLDRHEFRFHINQLPHLMQELNKSYITQEMIEMIEVPLYEPATINVKMPSSWVPRDYQEPIVEYLCGQEVQNELQRKQPVTKFVGIRTGGGKTSMALKAISQYGKRAAIVIQPKYIEKWIEDVEKNFGINKKSIIVVQGSGQLKTLLLLAQSQEINASIIIISAVTIQNFIKNYEKFGDKITEMGYACKPYEMFEKLGVGMRLIDEVHQSFHLFFKIDCYTHAPYCLSLSATLTNLDNFMLDMYKVAYPMHIRYKDAALKRYIKVKAVMYSIKEGYRIKTEEWGNVMYSHHAFERSIMRNQDILDNYLTLIHSTALSSFFKDYRQGDKLAIFASSVDMCTIIADYFKRNYPNLTVKRYVGTENDPYTNLIDSDIRVTTIQSGGTAHDIPNLTTVILTSAVESIQSNIQTVGRLREIPNRDTRFVYLVWQDNAKHMKYHYSKKENLKDRVLTHNEIVYPYML